MDEQMKEQMKILSHLNSLAALWERQIMGFVLVWRNLKHKDNKLFVRAYREMEAKEDLKGILRPSPWL